MNRLLHYQVRRLTRNLAICIAANIIAAVVVSLLGLHPRYAAVFAGISLALLVPLYAINID